MRAIQRCRLDRPLSRLPLGGLGREQLHLRQSFGIGHQLGRRVVRRAHVRLHDVVQVVRVVLQLVVRAVQEVLEAGDAVPLLV